MAVNTRTPLPPSYQSYLLRAISDGGAYEQVPTVQFLDQYNKIMSYGPSLVLFPSAEKPGTLYTITPNTSSADFSVTRASSGSYFDRNGILRLAVANEPRLDWNPSNGQFNGVLVEPAATNRIVQTTTYSSPWSISPTHQITDDLFLLNSGKNLKVLVNDGINSTASSICLRQTIPIQQGVNTLSFFVKKTTTHSSIGVWGFDSLGSYSVGYDVDTLVVTRPQTSIRYTNRTGSITPLGNNIFYCTETFTSNTGSNVFMGFSPTTSGAQTMIAGQEISVSGFQLEGSGSTSYIPTQATTGSRASDVIQSPLLNFNTTSWTVFFEIEYLTDFIAQSGDVSASPLIWYFRRTLTGVNFFNQNAQQNIGSFVFSPANSQKRFRAILSFNGSTINAYVNGTKIANNITPTNLSPYQTYLSANTNRLSFSKVNLIGGFDGPHVIKSSALYTRALSDEEAINLTTL